MFTCTHHARQQAAAKGIPLTGVLEVARRPNLTIPSTTKGPHGRETVTCRQHGGEQVKACGETADGLEIVVAVNTCCKRITTVFLDKVLTPVRDDQRAQGVTGYYGPDGRWRAA
jgi:hypothetical protein